MNAPLPKTRPERALTWLLRINGVITSLAILAVFMPVQWMNDTHRYLGMGDAPRAPIFEYLARTVSFLYFVHGALCLLLSTDVRRFGPVITYVATIEMVFALLLFWIDQKAGMPRTWTLTEAPTVIAISTTTLYLRLKSARHHPSTSYRASEESWRRGHPEVLRRI
jgi:hypothetical protein